MVRGIDDIGIVQFAHRLEFRKHAADLDINVFAAGKLSTNFIANGSLVASFPYAANCNFVAQLG